MSRIFTVGLLASFLGAMTIGCGPAKELPDEVARPKEPERVPAAAAEAYPRTSEPAAKAVVDRAIKAITQNHPEQLTKARVSIEKMSGRVNLPNNTSNSMTESEREIKAVWPDRLRVTYQFKDGPAHRLIWIMHSPFGWSVSGIDGKVPTANPMELANEIRNNLLAEHWLLMGLGYDEPGAVLFDARPIIDGASGKTTIKIHLPDGPIYQGTFSNQTGLPLRIEYELAEANQKVRVKKAAVVTDHKESNGLMLPWVMETYLNDQLGERWTIDSWEFPEKLPDADFVQPK